MARPSREVLEERQRLEAQGRRRCRSCNTIKPLDAFGFHQGVRRDHCKPCVAARMREYALAAKARDPEKYLAGKRASVDRWRENNRDRYLEVARNANLKHKYGVTSAAFDDMLERQAGGCAICGAEEVQQGPRVVSLHVDHDHATRRVRGLLCGPCNRGLGYFFDNPHLLAIAIAYLEAPA